MSIRDQILEAQNLQKSNIKVGFLEKGEKLRGGVADGKTVESIAKKHKVDTSLIQSQLKIGLEIEREHTNDKSVAREVALDHLYESPNYYTYLKKMENKLKH